MLEENRTLTNEDVKVIVAMLRKEMTEQFYRDVGRGVWGIIWRTAVGALLILAAYGAIKNPPNLGV